MITAATATGLSVRQLCALFGVNRAWYHAARGRAPADPDGALRAAVEQLALEFPRYGYRRVTAALVRAGWAVNHKRVVRVMRDAALLCRPRRRFVRTTQAGPGRPVYPNLLPQTTLSGLNQAWIADITYIRLPTRFVYLASILDAYSRRCIGWQVSREIDTALALGALERALATRQPAAGWIHHSDRGGQYASAAYVARLEAAGARISMSRKGNPYDNARAESFFKTLKSEEVELQEYQTVEEAAEHIGHFIEAVYNAKRLHSSLGYRPPNEFEAAQAAPGKD
jgi:putative transposase